MDTHLKRVFKATINPPTTPRDATEKKDKRMGKLVIELVRLSSSGQDSDYVFSNVFLSIFNFEQNLNIYTKLADALNHYKPYIQVIYFKIGEKNVRQEYTIVKDFIATQNGESYNLEEYVKTIVTQPLLGKRVEISLEK